MAPARSGSCAASSSRSRSRRSLAVTLFHFFWAWNDFFVPLLYLANKPELQPLSIGIQQYNALYASQPTLIQASAVLAMIVPVVIFFLAQRAFMQGVVVTGVDK